MVEGITITREKLNELRIEYRRAVADKKESFMFEGHEILTTYAKYLIEYLESKFK